MCDDAQYVIEYCPMDDTIKKYRITYDKFGVPIKELVKVARTCEEYEQLYYEKYGRGLDG